MGNAFLAGQSGGVSNSKIKEYLNSTVGTDNEISLDKLIPYYIALQSNDTIKEYEVAGTYLINVPIWASKIKVTACAGGGAGGYVSKSYGGGGGGAAILEQIYSLSDTIKSLTVIVGRGGVFSANTTPINGGNTSISEIGLSLLGGKGGNGATGGAAGGTGGGAGGNAEHNGNAGITGAGGNAVIPDDYNSGGGGGGGSLGAGGNGRGSNATGSDGVLGGGGGGAYSTYGYSGGDGYVKLEFLP